MIQGLQLRRAVGDEKRLITAAWSDTNDLEPDKGTAAESPGGQLKTPSVSIGGAGSREASAVCLNNGAPLLRCAASVMAVILAGWPNCSGTKQCYAIGLDGRINIQWCYVALGKKMSVQSLMIAY